jgi:cell division protein FtsQ
MPPQASSQVRVPMDPRIRRRRIEVRRDQGRRRLRLVLALLAVLLLTAGTWTVAGSPLADVDRVRVVGAEHTPAAEVARATAVRRGTPMVKVDEGRAARRVEGLPWVATAEVDREWPSTVVVTVTERTPTAVTRTHAGEWALVDAAGRVLGVVAEAPPGLAVLEGLPPAAEPGATLDGGAAPLTVVAALTPELRARVRAVVTVAGEQVELRLTPRGTVRLGRPTDLAAKLRALERVLAQVDTRDLAVLDVRLPSSPVLTRE